MSAGAFVSHARELVSYALQRGNARISTCATARIPRRRDSGSERDDFDDADGGDEMDVVSAFAGMPAV